MITKNKTNIRVSQIQHMQSVLFGNNKIQNNSFGGWENYVSGKAVSKPKRVRNRNKKKNQSLQLSSDENIKLAQNKNNLNIMLSANSSNTIDDRFQKLQKNINEMVKKQAKSKGVSVDSAGHRINSESEEKKTSGKEKFNMYNYINKQQNKQKQKKQSFNPTKLAVQSEKLKSCQSIKIYLQSIRKEQDKKLEDKMPISKRVMKFQKGRFYNNMQMSKRSQRQRQINSRLNKQQQGEDFDAYELNQNPIKENFKEICQTKQNTIESNQNQSQKFFIFLKNKPKEKQQQKQVKIQQTKDQHIAKETSFLSKLKQFLHGEKKKSFRTKEPTTQQLCQQYFSKREGSSRIYILQQENPSRSQCGQIAQKTSVFVQLMSHNDQKCNSCIGHKRRKAKEQSKQYTDISIKTFLEGN